MDHKSTYGNLVFYINDSVYEPAEDSFLLAKQVHALRGRVLDVGTGSGIQAIVNAKANPKNEVTGIDINPRAVECAIQNAKANRITNATFIVSDLFENVTGRFDGIIFNPPYLPGIKTRDLKHKTTELALSGGRTGRELTDRFIRQFPEYLNAGGTVLLLQSSINNHETTKKILARKGFNSELLGQESFFLEKLYILKIRKEK